MERGQKKDLEVGGIENQPKKLQKKKNKKCWSIQGLKTYVSHKLALLECLLEGRIALKGILERKVYNDFMQLSSTLCILVLKKINEQFKNKAEEFVSKFLSDAAEIYGVESMVYNVHKFSHLSSEAKEFEFLDHCSAFPFENYM